MVDVLSIVIGLVVGAAAVAIMFEVTGRGREKPTDVEKLTTGWRLGELRKPVLVARDVMGVDVPAGTMVLASGLVDPEVQKRCNVRQVPPVRAEFALDLETRKALLFMAGIQPGAMAMVSVDPPVVERLETEFRTLWDRAGEYVERYKISELAGRKGVTVETEGFVQDVLPWKERFMIRLEDGGAIIGVLVSKDPDSLKEQRIRVKGRLDRDETGYAVIEAEDVRRLG